MKILFEVNSGGGLYKFRAELIKQLISENHEVYVSLPIDKWTPAITEMGCICCEIIVDRHGKNPFKDFELIKTYKKLIKEIKPDIVFTYTIKPNSYGGMACASLGIPYVANITGLGTAIENGGVMQKIALTVYKYGLRKAQKVFFQNTENRDFLLSRGIVKGAYDLLPGSGVNLEKFRLLDYPNGDTVDFSFISRIMKEKGIDQYLEAAQIIRKRHPETRFHVCGFCEQAYEDRLRELENNGIIINHGLVSDITEIQKKSSCTIHPTYYPEGLSNVLLESAASGRPIITTDRSGCREVIDDGVNGFIVKQKDTEDLVRQIEKFLALPWEKRREMGLAGRAKVEKDFDRRIVVEKYMKELEKIKSMNT